MPRVRLKVPVCVGSYDSANTITSRSGESLWLTVPTVDKDKPTNQRKIGSEVMSKVQVPPGYQLVGFDFD